MHSIMKPFFKSSALLARLVPTAVLLIAGTLAGHAQSYSIDWFTIDGGGGTSSGGNFAVTGTIGQPDAGTRKGGGFMLSGGFWGALIPVQETGAPFLFIQPGVAGNASISWSPATPGYVLQYNDNLATTNWLNANTGATNPVSIPTVPSIRYFRLYKP